MRLHTLPTQTITAVTSREIGQALSTSWSRKCKIFCSDILGLFANCDAFCIIKFASAHGILINIIVSEKCRLKLEPNLCVNCLGSVRHDAPRNTTCLQFSLHLLIVQTLPRLFMIALDKDMTGSTGRLEFFFFKLLGTETLPRLLMVATERYRASRIVLCKIIRRRDAIASLYVNCLLRK